MNLDSWVLIMEGAVKTEVSSPASNHAALQANHMDFDVIVVIFHRAWVF